MVSVLNGRLGDLRISGLELIRVGVQTPSDLEASGGVRHIVAFQPPAGRRQIKPGDMVQLDGEPMRVLSYAPSGISRDFWVMQLGAAA